MFFEHMNTKLVNTGRFARSRHATDSHTNALAAIGQAAVDNLLRFGLMIGVDTLDKGNGLTEDCDIAFDDALHHLCNRQFATTKSVTFQIGINDALSCHATIDLQTGEFGTILWMFHILLSIDGDNHFRPLRVIGNHKYSGTRTGLFQIGSICCYLQSCSLTRSQRTFGKRHLQTTGKELQR